jgi:hypothetical protein
MSEFTRPTAMISYASAVGTVASTIYLNNRITETSSKLNTKITDLNEDIGIVRDGVKEKVPMLEKGLNHLAGDIKNVIGAINNHSANITKLSKMEKRLARCIGAVEDMMDSLAVIENRQLTLINALKAKGTLEGITIESAPHPVAPPPAPKQIVKQKRSSRLVSSSDESESSADEKRRSRKSKKTKGKQRDESSDEDEDEISQVARLASRK